MPPTTLPVDSSRPLYAAELDAAIDHHRAGQRDEAERAYNHILVQHPNCADAHNLLGILTEERGDLSGALRRFEAAIAIAPFVATFHYHRAWTLQTLGRFGDACREYERAIELDPHHVQAMENLAIVQLRVGDRRSARQTMERALGLTPNSPQLLANYAEVLRQNQDLVGAKTAAQRAIELAPEYLAAHSNLAVILFGLGDINGAREQSRQLYEADPTNTRAHSSLLMSELYLDGFDPTQSFAAHRGWDEQHGAPQRATATSTAARDRTKRPLRIGYVSPDLRRHAVARFIEPILQHHDHEAFEVYCYSDAQRSDATTNSLRNLADHWRDSADWSDEKLAATIRNDHIDILLDLAGHTKDNRMRMFAQRNAPVQISYCGYPASSGLATMDYRITDDRADPAGTTEQWHSETLLRLPDTFLCYSPIADAPAPIDPPVIRNGYITFASFNNLAKVTRATVATWSKLLKALPTARLLLKAVMLSYDEPQQRILGWFAEEGIPPQRLEMIGLVDDDAKFIALYNRVDIALDTFPYHGTTTTCDALWMGVPVISQAGAHHVSRVGVSLLHAVGLDDLIAPSASAVIDKALLLANDIPRLKQLRRDLRRVMSVLPLTQGSTFTRQFEELLHRAWIGAASVQTSNRAASADATTATNRTSDNEGTLMSIEILLPGNVRCFAKDSLDEPTSYILREQSDWFESDIQFVRRYLRPGMRMLDIGAGIGVYTLTAAHRVGRRGVVDAVEGDPEMLALLRVAQEANAYEQLSVHGLEGTTTLDRITRTSPAHATGYDLIRIDGEINAEEALAQLRDVLSATAPMIMVFTHADTAIAENAQRLLAPLGYEPYVYLPGLGQLARDCPQIADPYQLNLFFATAERASELNRHGLLAAWRDESELSLPPTDSLDWHEHLARLPFSTAFAPLWNTALANATTPGAQAQYREALNLYVRAHSVDTDHGNRLGYLLAALNRISSAIATHANGSRLLTLARICSELGLRNTAVKALTMLRNMCADATTPDLSEPFLPPLSQFEMLCEQNSPGAWLIKVVTTAHELLTSFSSYFNDNETVHYLAGLEQQNLLTPTLQRRYDMQLARLSGKSHRVTSPSRPNPPLAVLYQLRGSGGTLISKCLASIDGNALLSEVNPSVCVDDPLDQAKRWYGLVGDEEFDRFRHRAQLNYRESIKLIAERLGERGQKLILRDWTQIDFLPDSGIAIARYALSQAEALGQDFALNQTFFMRHPLDTYLSSSKRADGDRKLGAFMRGYCELARLAQAEGFFRYEDFCAAPQKTMRALCAALNANYSDHFMHRYANYRNITGAVAHQGGDTIKRPSRPHLDEQLIEELRNNDDYMESIELLGYERGF